MVNDTQCAKGIVALVMIDIDDTLAVEVSFINLREYSGECCRIDCYEQVKIRYVAGELPVLEEEPVLSGNFRMAVQSRLSSIEVFYEEGAGKGGRYAIRIRIPVGGNDDALTARYRLD
jgi:hypothetical protein